MPNALIALGAAFLVAGLLARLGRRIGVPTIPFFMAAGVLTGPNTPGLVLVEDPATLEVFAAVGLIMLLFHLGLEFSLDDLIDGGRRLLAAGSVYLLLNVGAGFVFGLSLGWGVEEALVIAGAVGISSSAIVTKLLVELDRLVNPETRMVLGIIVVEDVFLALYLAFLQPILGGAEGALESLVLFGEAFAFLTVLFLVARFGARFVGRVISSDEDDLLTVLLVGLAILVAGLAEELGASDAIGALMAGFIVSQTKFAPRIERLVLPLRDAFAAVFFFVFGLTLDPEEIAQVALPVAAAVVLSMMLNVVAGIISARIHGLGPRSAANVGLTLLSRGEFSIVIASFGLAAGMDERIAPFVALYVLILAIVGPLLTSHSRLLAKRLPKTLFARSPVR